MAVKPFPLAGTAVHIAPDGSSSLWDGPAIRRLLQRRPQGHVLGAFTLRKAADVHPETWEIHPAGDEVLIMLDGELAVECTDGVQRSTSRLEPFHGVVIAKGVWHRLTLRKPGLLLTLSPPAGTQFSQRPGSPIGTPDRSDVE